MSKYNLTDILEQYRIGSGWTTDFDYDGMLKTGLGTSIDTPIEVLKKMSDDFEDVNYHRENSHLQDAIDAIEIGDMVEAEGRLSDFHIEIRKTQEDQGMDIEPTLGKFMDTKMSSMMNEDGFDEARQAAIESSEEAAGIKEAAMSEDKMKMIDAAAKMIKDRILKDVPMDIIMDFVKTHLQDIRKMSNSEIKDEFEEFRSVNYDYIDENLKAHFNRFK